MSLFLDRLLHDPLDSIPYFSIGSAAWWAGFHHHGPVETIPDLSIGGTPRWTRHFFRLLLLLLLSNGEPHHILDIRFTLILDGCVDDHAAAFGHDSIGIRHDFPLGRSTEAQCDLHHCRRQFQRTANDVDFDRATHVIEPNDAESWIVVGKGVNVVIDVVAYCIDLHPTFDGATGIRALIYRDKVTRRNIAEEKMFRGTPILVVQVEDASLGLDIEAMDAPTLADLGVRIVRHDIRLLSVWYRVWYRVSCDNFIYQIENFSISMVG